MEDKIAWCPACGELEECNLEIPYALLIRSIKDGCKVCAILHRGVSEFLVGDVEDIESLVLSVDISLLVTVKGRAMEKTPLVEFYTLPGWLTLRIL